MKKIFNLSSKYNLMIAVIAGGLLLVLVIGLLLIRPAWSRLKELGREIPAAQQQRDLKKQDYQNLQTGKKFLDDNQKTVEQVNTAVPIQPEIPSILVTLESLAKQNGVFLTSFTPQQAGAGATAGAGAPAGAGAAGGARTTGTADSVLVTANFQGPYSSLINFLYNLELSLRLVDVKTVTVSSSSGTLQGSISFQAYYKQVDGGPKPTTSVTGVLAPPGGPTPGGNAR